LALPPPSWLREEILIGSQRGGLDPLLVLEIFDPSVNGFIESRVALLGSASERGLVLSDDFLHRGVGSALIEASIANTIAAPTPAVVLWVLFEPGLAKPALPLRSG